MPAPTLNQRIFNSVFGRADISQRTPVATPATGFTAPGEAFGVLPPAPVQRNTSSLPSIYSGSLNPKGIGPDGHIQDQVRWDRSWHLLTRTLSLPAFPESRGILEPLKPERESMTPEFYSALEDVLYPEVNVPFARQTEDIIAWHASQVRHHFLHQVLPVILRLRSHDTPDDTPERVLFKSVKVLETAYRQYVHGVSFIKEQIDLSSPGTSMPIMAKFWRDLDAVISNSAMDPLSTDLNMVMRRYIFSILGLSRDQPRCVPIAISPESHETEKSIRELLGLIESCKKVGLAGERFQVIFAEIMNDATMEYVHVACKGVWSLQDSGKMVAAVGRNSILPRTAHNLAPSWCVTGLCEWIDNRYSKLTIRVLRMINPEVEVSWIEKEKFKEMGIGMLAELRTKELFDIVGNWPNSNGALEDLRTAITTPQRRLRLTEVFSETLRSKLLHPSTSTLQILQTYISMIWSFHSLDHSKVLLDRVAYPLQLYLCSREDTVRIIVTGLLSDTHDVQGNPIGRGSDKLVELAQLLNSGSDQLGALSNDEELDWHDMDWVPDPVDAGPGYKRSKSADIIGTLIGVLGSQDVFIKEFQNIIGENFLRHDGSFEKEVKVLELLKTRFGEAPLQACEVMLKDIQDSQRVDNYIRKTQNLEPSDIEISVAQQKRASSKSNGPINPEGQLKPSLHAKILSRLFWPQLQDESYVVPDSVQFLLPRYETGFEALKTARKLTWLHLLGQATVELDLEDRLITEEVHTWQASVIWAFDSIEPGLQRTVQQLVTSLKMDEALVRNALRFWADKLVLHEITPGTYAVLETLNQEDRARADAQAAASAATAGNDESLDDTGLAATDAIAKEKMGMYWQFIQGMLTNSAKEMPLPRIAMMLKVLIVDGFPYSNEELQEFLGTKVADGSLELAGGKYRLKK
ncbi:hypothetical protein LZ554_007992 [Drepanopeziza brunnea f. sp. 'monogermtubi']|nr:hypothetical protein LZ554_007992 [Drepanopeziza brunnea f. sp. 'monogermtubi']